MPIVESPNPALVPRSVLRMVICIIAGIVCLAGSAGYVMATDSRHSQIAMAVALTSGVMATVMMEPASHPSPRWLRNSAVTAAFVCAAVCIIVSFN